MIEVTKCPRCGMVLRGNGARTSHLRRHVRDDLREEIHRAVEDDARLMKYDYSREAVDDAARSAYALEIHAQCAWINSTRRNYVGGER